MEVRQLGIWRTRGGEKVEITFNYSLEKLHPLHGYFLTRPDTDNRWRRDGQHSSGDPQLALVEYLGHTPHQAPLANARICHVLATVTDQELREELARRDQEARKQREQRLADLKRQIEQLQAERRRLEKEKE